MNEVPGAAAGDRLAERVAQAGILAAAGICLATLLLGSLGLLARWPLAGLTVLLLAFAWRAAGRQAGEAPLALPRPPWPLWALGLPLLLVQCLVALPMPPDDWDAMTYHLFLPARWLEAGSLIHVPTVFGDPAGAFAPQNGALIFTWWMGLAGGDGGISLLQVGALILLAASLWLLARRLGAGPEAAAMALATLPWLAPFERWTFSANVDVFLAAFFTAAAAFLLGEGRRRDLVFGGLALGLAAGTKTLGLPLAAGLLAIAAPRLRRAPRRDLAAFAGAAALTGAYWWLRNWISYGNPLFPLDFAPGGWRLWAGIFSAAELRSQSIFHIEGPGAWVASIWLQWGSGACLLTLAGIAGLLAGARRLAIELALLAAGWIVFVWRVVPHNDQARFLLPALALALAGWAILLDRLSRRFPRALLFGLALALLGLASRPDLFVLQRLAWLASPADLRSAALADADFNLWRDGYLPFNHPGIAPKRIAYAGFNVPYALVGPGRRHHVVYCNVEGQPEDGLWELWRAAAEPPALPSQLYRRNEGPAAWLACLERERIDTVAVFRLLPLAELRSPDDDDGFPVERRWLREHPALFRPVLQQPNAEIWSFRPSGGAAAGALEVDSRARKP